jgi:hypothetical protein
VRTKETQKGCYKNAIASAPTAKPNQGRAPIENLSSAKQKALMACFKGDGTLHKRYGVWAATFAGAYQTGISGNTVADLARDGMLSVIVTRKIGSARLTPLGSWFARTVADEITAAA